MVSNYYKITIMVLRALRFPENRTYEMTEWAGLGYNLYIKNETPSNEML